MGSNNPLQNGANPQYSTPTTSPALSRRGVAEICDFNKNSYGIPLIKTPWGEAPIIYADHTASGIPYRKIDDYMRCSVLPYYANVHSNGYSGRKMAHLICQSKAAIRKSLGATDDDAVIFTGSGSSSAIMHAIHAMDLIRNRATAGDERPIVLISDNEHHSNFLPWKTMGAYIDLEIIPTTKDGLLDLGELATAISKYSNRKTRIASFSACSNVTGVVQPVKTITRILKVAGWTVCYDYACSAPYVPICMHPRDGETTDCIFISPHKFVGGAGTPGLLVISKHLIRNQCPMFPSGGTVSFANSTAQVWVNDSEKRESGGTPNICGIIRCGLAFMLKDYMQHTITRRETELVGQVKAKLRAMRGVKMLIDTSGHQLPIFPLVFSALHYNLAVCLLSQLFGVQVRGGVSCNGLAAEKLLKINPWQESQLIHSIIADQDIRDFGYGWVRVTFHFTMTNEIVRYILAAIAFVAEHGHKFRRFYKYDAKLNNWSLSKRAQNADNAESFGDLDFTALEPACLKPDDFTREMASRLLDRSHRFLARLAKMDALKSHKQHP